MTGRLVPARQCPGSRDCRTWAYVPRVEPDQVQGHAAVDLEVAAAWDALEVWLAAVGDALDASPALSSMRLPHPEPGREPIHTGLVDSDQSHVLVSSVQKAGEEVDGLYVGLITQEPSRRWVGLAGSFVPTCSLCDGPGVAKATDRALNLLTRFGFEEIPASAVPEGARPHAGWFDRGRLQTICRRPDSGRTEWRQWPPETQPGSLAAAMLVRVRPVISTMAGLVICETLAQAIQLPEVLAADPAAWTWSSGTPQSLQRACHHRPRSPVKAQGGAGEVRDWWAYRIPGSPPLLERGVRPPRPPNGETAVPSVWTLTGEGASLLSELSALLHSPA